MSSDLELEDWKKMPLVEIRLLSSMQLLQGAWATIMNAVGWQYRSAGV